MNLRLLFAAACIHEGVSQKKCRLQIRELLICERDFPFDGLNGDRKRLPVQIADGNSGAYQDRDSPAQDSSPMGTKKNFAHAVM